MLTTEDRQQIASTLALHAHLSDENQFDRLDELFVDDAVYDMRPSGIGIFEGIDVIRAGAERIMTSGHAPTAHFLTNVLIDEGADDTATAKSKGLMIMHDGSLHAVVYDDTLRRENGRWLISRRVITPSTPAAAR